MTFIGTFTGDGAGYKGEVATITISLKDVKLVPSDKVEGSKSPDFTVRYGKNEIGAAWNKTSKKGNPYISIQFDDPALPRPVNCRLIRIDENVMSLMWDRPSRAKS